jgi:hypothetical protein
VGLAPTGKRRLVTAHADSGRLRDELKQPSITLDVRVDIEGSDKLIVAEMPDHLMLTKANTFTGGATIRSPCNRQGNHKADECQEQGQKSEALSIGPKSRLTP